MKDLHKNFFNKENIKVKKPSPMISYNFTHPNKILYPEQGITKLELAEYYMRVHKWILPYIKQRPLSVVRCPQGYTENCFYQKHIEVLQKNDLYSIKIKEKSAIPVGLQDAKSDGYAQPYLYIKDKYGLMALVQWSVLEIHPWGCRIDKLEKPDQITFDLDPSPEVEWKEVIEAAYFVKENLDKINLRSFIKTTGGKGLHIVIPIKRLYSWNEIEIFAHTFADYLVSLKPHSYVATMSKAKRRGKIFIDYLRNQRGATAIAPYSTRAKENAPVSTPLSWDELSPKLKSTTFTIRNIAERLSHLKEDPWGDFFKVKQKLPL